MEKEDYKKDDEKCVCDNNCSCDTSCSCGDDCSCGDNCSCEGGSHLKRNCGKLVFAIIGILLLAGIITISILRDKIINPQYRSVNVVGQGRVTYNPDIAVLNLGVQIDKAISAEEALNQLNTKMTAIVKAVKEIGVNEADIQTQNYSLYPQYDYKDNISVVAGYNANQQVVIKVLAYDKDPERLSRVIGAASKAGVNQVNSLTFDASNMNDLKQEAKLQAISDAKARGQVLADAAGVKLDKITGWYENYVSPSPMYTDYAKGGMGAGGNESFSAAVPSGSREVVIEMNITYNIK
jgi:hypothetical protein